MEKNKLIIAIDFDGVITERDEYPNIGIINQNIIGVLKSLKKFGHNIILWTCRSGEKLNEAVQACKEHGIEFDAINDNLITNINKYDNNCRKIYADIYVDDKNWMIPNFLAYFKDFKVYAGKERKHD